VTFSPKSLPMKTRILSNAKGHQMYKSSEPVVHETAEVDLKCLIQAIMIEPSDFVSFPAGGQTSFAKQMMSAFGNRLALVGFSSDDTPTGIWVEKEFNGTIFKFLSVARIIPTSKKPLIPLRLFSYLNIVRRRKAIMSLGIRNVFTQEIAVILAVRRWGWWSICYTFPGIGNPLTQSRYRWARIFARVFDSVLVRALKGVDTILAAADNREIESFVQRTNGQIPASRISQFPTRVDTAYFRPFDRSDARRNLGIPQEGPIIVSCGRISSRKGWDLVLDAFRLVLSSHPKARLYFVGDGEDRGALEKRIAKWRMAGSVIVTGFQDPSKVVLYNSACDVFVSGSHWEGWPVAQLEALACGAVIVSTDVSGAREIAVNGENGFVCPSRDPREFADAIGKALLLRNTAATSLAIAGRFSISSLAPDLGRLWAAVS